MSFAFSSVFIFNIFELFKNFIHINFYVFIFVEL